MVKEFSRFLGRKPPSFCIEPTINFNISFLQKNTKEMTDYVYTLGIGWHNGNRKKNTSQFPNQLNFVNVIPDDESYILILKKGKRTIKGKSAMKIIFNRKRKLNFYY